jgi:hypothetical protein
MPARSRRAEGEEVQLKMNYAQRQGIGSRAATTWGRRCSAVERTKSRCLGSRRCQKRRGRTTGIRTTPRWSAAGLTDPL